MIINIVTRVPDTEGEKCPMGHPIKCYFVFAIDDGVEMIPLICCQECEEIYNRFGELVSSFEATETI